jgi:tRNA U34 5-methylaminomethyl-2-thiouridine-forming methyltransferase MnmC
MDETLPHPTHEIVTFESGQASVREIASGRAMHSALGSWEEAQAVYVTPSRLAERLSRPGPPLVLWDVGMGIAANALLAIETAKELGAKRLRELQIVSFEKTLEGLALALEHPDLFPFLSAHGGAVSQLMERRVWIGEGVTWRLFYGDYLEAAAEAPAPELVFYDHFGPTSCPELWSERAFALTLGRPDGVTLLTYSAASAVREALTAAGYRVGRGAGTGVKRETTIASTIAGEIAQPLKRFAK